MSEQQSSCARAEQKSDSIEYRDIPGFPRYQAGSDGSIWSDKSSGHGADGRTRAWHRLKPSRRSGGYVGLIVYVEKKKISISVHRLVAMAFHGPCPEGMEAAHANGIRTDNRSDNLSWKTHAHNNADRKSHGTHGRKLTESDVTEIITFLADPKYSMSEIGAMYGVHLSQIEAIAYGKTWKHVTKGERQLVRKKGSPPCPRIEVSQ